MSPTRVISVGQHFMGAVQVATCARDRIGYREWWLVEISDFEKDYVPATYLAEYNLEKLIAKHPYNVFLFVCILFSDCNTKGWLQITQIRFEQHGKKGEWDVSVSRVSTPCME